MLPTQVCCASQKKSVTLQVVLRPFWHKNCGRIDNDYINDRL